MSKSQIGKSQISKNEIEAEFRRLCERAGRLGRIGFTPVEGVRLLPEQSAYLRRKLDELALWSDITAVSIGLLYHGTEILAIPDGWVSKRPEDGSWNQYARACTEVNRLLNDIASRLAGRFGGVAEGATLEGWVEQVKHVNDYFPYCVSHRAFAKAADSAGAKFVGPNTLGVLSPGKGVLGMIGGRAVSARSWFLPGPVGICSRSGGITSSMAYYLAQEAIGATTLVHVGGDAIVGLPLPKVVCLFQADPETKAIVMFGEIGTSQEEQVADLIEHGEVTKPLVAYIGGKGAKSGTRFSHAGAIIEGGRGTREGKVARLQEVGAHLMENFGDIPMVTKKVLEGIGAL